MTNLNKPEFYYEDLEVIQVDLVDKPATKDTFLVVRSEDGVEEQIPVIRTDLSGLVDNKNKSIDNIVSTESLVHQSNKVTREDVTMELTEVMAKLEELNGKATETLTRAEALLQNITDKENVKREDEVPADPPAEDTPVDAPVETPEPAQDAPVGAEVAPVEAEPAPVVEAPVEAPVASESPDVEVVREMLDKMSDSLVKLSDKLDNLISDNESIKNRVGEVERSMLVPNSAPVEKNDEPPKVERNVSLWDGVIDVR